MPYSQLLRTVYELFCDEVFLDIRCHYTFTLQSWRFTWVVIQTTDKKNIGFNTQWLDDVVRESGQIFCWWISSKFDQHWQIYSFTNGTLYFLLIIALKYLCNLYCRNILWSYFYRSIHQRKRIKKTLQCRYIYMPI